MNNFKVDLMKNRISSDGSIMKKIYDFNNDQFATHEQLEYDFYKKPPLLTACETTVTVLDRRTNEEKKLIMFGSNNYIGATTIDSAVKKGVEVINKMGIGSGGVPLLSGTTIYQNELEQTIAKLKGVDDTILFSSGFAANIGVLVGLIRPNNLIVHDKLNHASLMDGSIMTGAKMVRYKHNDAASLDKVLQEYSPLYPDGILVVTDGVFSMDGDIANLPEIIEVVHKYNAILLIDDAHATCVIGEKGAGTLSHYGIKDRKNIVITGTLSKALGSVGGFIAGDQQIINYLRIFARSNMYSTSLPPSVCASVNEVIKYVQSSDITDTLKEKADYLRNKLKSAGFNVLKSQTPIIPIVVKDEEILTQMSKEIYQAGFFANYVFQPVVPPLLSRLRVSVMATHTFEQLDAFYELMFKIGKKYNII